MNFQVLKLCKQKETAELHFVWSQSLSIMPDTDQTNLDKRDQAREFAITVSWSIKICIILIDRKFNRFLSSNDFAAITIITQINFLTVNRVYLQAIIK